jgi:hypothetical protein
MTPKLTALAAVIGLIVASTAQATGGSSTASAPTVVYGQQEFGNTVTDEGGEAPDCDTTRGPGRSWWMLQVVTGDQITIDLEGQTEGDGFLMNVYPLGTNQFNVAQAQPSATTVDRQENREQLVFTAASTGAMPMDVETCDHVGTYDFTAYDAHAVRLGLPRASTLRPGGVLDVPVHSPDGGMITDSALQVFAQVGSHGSWRTVGIASVSDSVAPIRLHIPAGLYGRSVSLRVTARGSDYQTTTTTRAGVRVAR